MHGLTDLLEVGSRLYQDRGGRSTGLAVSQLGGECQLATPEAPLTALLLPPSLSGPPAQPELAARAAWLVDRHREGTLLGSICAGAFFLAEAGLLDGRRATTHWGLKEQLAERFPDVVVDTDKLIIDDGDIVTAGGLMAWVDLGLHLVNRFFGPTTTLAVSRFFVVDPGGREQRFYQTFAPALTHGDAAVLKLQRWLQAHASEKITVPSMAAIAGLGERTLLRRFRQATGLKPTEYVQQLRVGQARDLLEQSASTIDEIAWQVGYEDPGAFRKLFARVMGLSAAEYRRRFACPRQL